MSQLWSLVVVLLSVFVLGGRRGPVSFRAVKGKGGQSALELSCSAGNGGESASGGCGRGMMRVSFGVWWCCCRFLFWGAQGASQLPGCEGEGGPVSFGVVLFCGEWRRVSFRGLWRGDDVSQLWSLVVLLSVFVLGGAGGQSASGL